MHVSSAHQQPPTTPDGYVMAPMKILNQRLLDFDVLDDMFAGKAVIVHEDPVY